MGPIYDDVSLINAFENGYRQGYLDAILDTDVTVDPVIFDAFRREILRAAEVKIAKIDGWMEGYMAEKRPALS